MQCFRGSLDNVVERAQVRLHIVAQAAILVIDDMLQRRQAIGDRQQLVDLLLILRGGDLHVGVCKHMNEFVGDRVGIDGHRRRAQHLRGAQRPVEQRPVGAHDGDLVAFRHAQFVQAERDRTHVVVDFAPRPGLPDAAILVPERRAIAAHARMHAQELRKRVLRRATTGILLAVSHSPLPSGVVVDALVLAGALPRSGSATFATRIADGKRALDCAISFCQVA